jgi:short-subunit dehydrogenase
MSKATNEWALVTGAYSGIGLELSKLLAHDGYSVVLVARNAERLRNVAAELKQLGAPQTYCVAIDLAAANGADELVRRLKEQNIKVDVLINNAGFDVYGLFVETSYEQEQQMMLLNMIALTRLTKLLLPRMVHRKRGHVLNLGSIGSLMPCPLNAVYAATKSYVLSFSEALAGELRGTGVTITTLCPGATRTEFHQRAAMERIRLLRFGWGRADKVALAGYRAMKRGQLMVVPGFFNKFTMFMSNFIPRRARIFMAHYMASEA